jgi:hypothetical protein
MQATFYQFAKRTNSTKRPSGGQEFGIDLKAPCNIIDPEIKIATQSDPTGYNYCYLPTFSRYYWVKNWTYVDGLWNASLTVDTLASYRDEIGYSTEYVVRSSAKFDPKIADNLYPTKATITTRTIYTNSTPFTDDPESGSQGFFVVAVNAPGYVTFGGAIYFAMSGTTFQKLMAALLQNTDYLDISAEEISSNLTKALFNPIQYISKAFWIPCGNAAIGTPITEIPVGWWKMQNVGNAYVIQNTNDKNVFTFSISTPHHPQHITRGVYTDGAPYSEYTLYCPPFGEIKLNANLFVLQSTLYCRLTVDYRTGDAILDLSFNKDFNTIFFSTSGNVSVPVQLAQITTNVNELASLGGLIQTAVGAVAGGIESFFGGGDVINGIASGAQQMTVSSQSKGGVASVAKYGITPYLTGAFYDLVDDNNEHHGRPLCQKVQLFSIPGFMMVDDPDIALPATAAEIDSVKSYMKNGFFLE